MSIKSVMPSSHLILCRPKKFLESYTAWINHRHKSWHLCDADYTLRVLHILTHYILIHQCFEISVIVVPHFTGEKTKAQRSQWLLFLQTRYSGTKHETLQTYVELFSIVRKWGLLHKWVSRKFKYSPRTVGWTPFQQLYYSSLLNTINQAF